VKGRGGWPGRGRRGRCTKCATKKTNGEKRVAYCQLVGISKGDKVWGTSEKNGVSRQRKVGAIREPTL